MAFFILQPQVTEVANFISFWSERYDYRLDADYEKHLTKPLTKKALTALFE